MCILLVVLTYIVPKKYHSKAKPSKVTSFSYHLNQFLDTFLVNLVLLCLKHKCMSSHFPPSSSPSPSPLSPPLSHAIWASHE